MCVDIEIASQTHCTHLDMSVRCRNFPVVHPPLLLLVCTIIAFSILPCPLVFLMCQCSLFTYFVPYFAFLFIFAVPSNFYFYARRFLNVVLA